MLHPATSIQRVAPQKRDSSAANEGVRVIFIDPQPLTRDSVGMWLRSKLGEIQIGTAADVDDATHVFALNGGASLVLYHVGAESVDAPEVVRCLAELDSSLPGVPIAMLAAADDWGSIVTALRSGVKGYIPTSLHAAVIVEAIRLLCAGGTYAPVTSFLESQSGLPIERQAEPSTLGLDFSSRQLQIISCLRRGFANKNIAYQLSMSEGTVKVHIRNIMKKLGAQNRTQIVIMTSHLVIDPEQDVAPAPSEAPRQGSSVVRTLRHERCNNLALTCA